MRPPNLAAHHAAMFTRFLCYLLYSLLSRHFPNYLSFGETDFAREDAYCIYLGDVKLGFDIMSWHPPFWFFLLKQLPRRYFLQV